MIASGETKRIAAVLAACWLAGCASQPPADVVSGEGEALPPPVPGEVTAAFDRAIEAMRAENWVEAELELETLIGAHPGYPGPHVNLGIVYVQTGRPEAAEAEFRRALEIDPGYAPAHNRLGLVLREQGRFEAADAAYAAAIEADPGYAIAHYNRGVLNDLYLRRHADALGHYEAYQALQSEDDERVAMWIVDLRRRVGAEEAAAATQLARGAVQ